jgi:uncharacterized linocin/CFP29 family protein
MNLGRDKLSWGQELWDRIDQAVHAEAQRAKVAAKFLPMVGPIGEALTVAADRIDEDTMTVQEGDYIPVLEIWAEFGLTKPQVEQEERLGTAVTLATRATNLLAQAEDLLIFQGAAAVRHVLFRNNRVRLRTQPNAVARLTAAANEEVVRAAVRIPANGDPPEADRVRWRYSELIASGVARAYATLQSQGHYGPYALVLHTDPYADTFEPLANTLIMPADRIKPLVAAGFHGTGTLPERTGVLVSLGGNTMDLVMGVAPTTAVMQEDSNGLWRLRVLERFALRLKDSSAVVRLRLLEELEPGYPPPWWMVAPIPAAEMPDLLATAEVDRVSGTRRRSRITSQSGASTSTASDERDRSDTGRQT